MTGLAKQMAKGKPLTPAQQMHRKEVGGIIKAHQNQKKGMKDKMMAWNQLQKDKENMIQVPEQYETPQGEMEQLAYVTPEEMQMLKQQGGSGEMTPYGIPSFDKEERSAKEKSKSRSWGDKAKERAGKDLRNAQAALGGGRRSHEGWGLGYKGGLGGLGGGDGRSLSGGNMGGGGQGKEIRSDPLYAAAMGLTGRGGAPQPSGPSQADMNKLQGEFDQYKAGEGARKQAALDEYKGERRQQLTGEYGDYKGQYKELGSQIGGYKDKFDTLGQEARAVGDQGATAMKGLGEQYKGITGDAIAAEAQKGAEGIGAGADKIGGLEAGTRDIMGRQAGYESQIAGMADKVASGEAGQSQAAMLQGQMEQQRMAGQKGSEEKLRREMAQSGASPAEIAAKVAQFQRQSASDQSMASRSEALSSQLQGQQMGQQQMGVAAGLMGQALGATGQQMQGQAQLQSQGAQQAALRGQAAGMAMQGAQAQQGAQLQSLQGQAAMAQGAAGLAGQGIAQQAGMYGQGIGALQGQAGMVDQQAGMTQAQLNDVIAQQTEAFQASEAEKQRQANAAANAGGGSSGGGGGILGGITKAVGGLFSDIRLKENIELLEKGKGGDPNIYSFNYKWQPKARWSGVMAQELLGTKHADSVRTNSEGYYMVDYHKLGIQMKLLS